jgi:hypothetical protein
MFNLKQEDSAFQHLTLTLWSNKQTASRACRPPDQYPPLQNQGALYRRFRSTWFKTHWGQSRCHIHETQVYVPLSNLMFYWSCIVIYPWPCIVIYPYSTIQQDTLCISMPAMYDLFSVSTMCLLLSKMSIQYEEQAVNILSSVFCVQKFWRLFIPRTNCIPVWPT